MDNENKNKVNQFVAAAIVSSIFALFFFFIFPLVLFVFAIIPVPVVTDIVISMADIPISILGIEVPSQDSFAYKVTVAKWFWTPVFFASLFIILWKRRDG